MTDRANHQRSGIIPRLRPELAAIRSALLLSAVLIANPAAAADPQPYETVMPPTSNKALDQALRDVSLLLELSEVAPVGPFALVARAREDAERFVTALRSFGYYRSTVTVTIAGRSLDDPDIHAALDQAPAEPPLAVEIAIETGPLFHLRKIDIRGTLPPSVTIDPGIATGDPASAPEVLAGRERILDALHDAGHALAKVEQPVAYLIPDAEALDIVYQVDAGPRTDLGRIDVQGLDRVNESFVRRRIPLDHGDRFDAAGIEKTRQDLAGLGVFSSVRVRLGEQPDARGNLPITFEVVERPRQAVSVGAAYSTDLGGSISTTWQHRNLLGHAERLNLGLGVTQIGGNSTSGIGYTATAGFVKPDFLERAQDLRINLGAVRQRLHAYDQNTFSGEVLLSRRLGEHWSGHLGPSGEWARITQAGETRTYTLLGLPMTLKYDDTDSPLDPTRGMRATATLTPTMPLAGSTDPFVQMQLAGSGYLDLTGEKRSILALRGLIFDIEGASRFDLPPDKRAYAGGSATVRGYNFQSIGPRFADGKPQGGRSMAAATVEYRQRILDDWGAAAFLDAGQVTADGLPFTEDWRFGAGLGVRYYTGFGPIRLDVAMPVDPRPGSGSFELYIGLGQAF
jgi:translocation and assembly module TamA